MMPVSGRSLHVSVNVLFSIFIFELQSESSAIIFHVFGYLCTSGFDVCETAIV